MAISQYFVDPLAGVDAPAGGAIGAPWKTVQYALNTIVRNATYGDQINIKTGAADVLGASLSLAIYGTPTQTTPVIFRGYTAAANDGGIGEINGNGNIIINYNGSNYGRWVYLIDLKLASNVANHVIKLQGYNIIENCYIANTAGGCIYGSNTITIRYCYVNGIGTLIQQTAGTAYITHCVIIFNSWNSIYCANRLYMNECVLIAGAIAATAIYGWQQDDIAVKNCSFYSPFANTSYAIQATAGAYSVSVINCIFEGWSGVGGTAIDFSNVSGFLEKCAFYNNTASITNSGRVYGPVSPIILAASPFVNAVAGNFALQDVAALKGVGARPTFNTIATNTYIDIGAAQRQETGGGGGGAVSISPYRGNL